MTRTIWIIPALVVALAACDTDGADDAATTTTTVDAATTTQQATTTSEATTTTDPSSGGDGNGEATEVVMENIAFEPTEITVAPGTTVTWSNQDQVPHTATADDGLWDSGQLAANESFEFTFEEPGTYSYFCEVHPTQMEATVIVEG